MLERLNPTTAPKPFSRYSQAVLAPQDSEWLYISGQVGCDRERNIAEGFEAQADLAWGICGKHPEIRGLRRRGSGEGHRPADPRGGCAGVARGARPYAGAGRNRPAPSMIVAGLASPDMLIEVEGVAARSAERTA